MGRPVRQRHRRAHGVRHVDRKFESVPPPVPLHRHGPFGKRNGRFDMAQSARRTGAHQEFPPAIRRLFPDADSGKVLVGPGADIAEHDVVAG